MRFDGKRVTVMGLGRFGGGVGVSRFLLERGAAVTITDLDTAERLAESIAAVGDGAIYHLGGHRAEDFTDTDFLVVNPAVKPDSEWVRLAEKRGVVITTEMNLFFDLCPARIVGVTGSVGKTTTTAMIGAALAGPGTWVGGNIGRSLLGDLAHISAGDIVVLELSSAQLYRLGAAGRSPHVAVITNISQNHIDWHGSMRNYVAAKKQIIAHQTERDAAVLGVDHQRLRRWASRLRQRVFLWSRRREVPQGAFVRDGVMVARLDGTDKELFPIDAMRLPGEHNVSNAAAAVAACMALGADMARVAEAIVAFEGAEHRLEFVAEIAGVRYYNDSKATTPTSSIAALKAFDDRVVIILGGRDKGMDFARLARRVRKCRAVVLIGEMAERLDTLIAECSPRVRRVRAASVPDAVRVAASLAQPGDAVLLSPACTSFDMFRNFEERGRAFKQAVQSLAAEGGRAGC